MKLKQYFQFIGPYFAQKKFIDHQSDHTPALNDTIVSLTSITSRYKSLPTVIASVLNQSAPPHSVHLWIKAGTANLLPGALSALTGRGLMIHECQDVGPHTKLIHALREFPEYNIVTADDDIIYPHNWLSSLHTEHLLHPLDVSAYTTRQIRVESNSSNPLPYHDWTRIKEQTNHSHPHFMALGYTGVLYPPNTFNEEVYNIKNILTLCPKADDIWFKFMAILNQTDHRKIASPYGREIYLPFSQSVGLKYSNVKSTGNEDQARKLIQHYHLEDYFSL